ncbi:response regulator [Thiovibrio frasassiensis]|uniref:Response regulator n=1 Tax=Thiovibrio frasassiensis TaxID=2984131 RepID=A0A9X4RMJ9_9BACT|nr:response regulator [Thiovibrio frasassiensis]MDG4476258.1 response regulator [Thiovibrio frasassiensis]
MRTRHILLAERKPNLQHSLGLMLKQADYRVQLTDTTEEALTMLKGLHNTPLSIDLFIADLDTGTEEVCRLFMQSLSANDITTPYLVLAEELCDKTLDAFKNHGCLGCITKPFEPQTLLRSVHNALEQLSSQERLPPERKPLQPNTKSAIKEQPSHLQGEQSCKTSSYENGFRFFSLRGFW